jgi:Fe2+ transport system protein B
VRRASDAVVQLFHSLALSVCANCSSLSKSACANHISTYHKHCVCADIEIEESVKRTEESVKRIEESVKRTEENVKRIEECVKRTEESVKRIEESVKRMEENHISTYHKHCVCADFEIEESVKRTEESVKRIEESVKRITFQHITNIVYVLILKFWMYKCNMLIALHTSQTGTRSPCGMDL